MPPVSESPSAAAALLLAACPFAGTMWLTHAFPSSACGLMPCCHTPDCFRDLGGMQVPRQGGIFVRLAPAPPLNAHNRHVLFLPRLRARVPATARQHVLPAGRDGGTGARADLKPGDLLPGPMHVEQRLGRRLTFLASDLHRCSAYDISARGQHLLLPGAIRRLPRRSPARLSQPAQPGRQAMLPTCCMKALPYQQRAPDYWHCQLSGVILGAGTHCRVALALAVESRKLLNVHPRPDDAAAVMLPTDVHGCSVKLAGQRRQAIPARQQRLSRPGRQSRRAGGI